MWISLRIAQCDKLSYYVWPTCSFCAQIYLNHPQGVQISTRIAYWREKMADSFFPEQWSIIINQARIITSMKRITHNVIMYKVLLNSMVNLWNCTSLVSPLNYLYKTEHCNLQGHSPLTSIYLYIQRLNFDILRVWNSYPQLEVSYDVECKSLNYALNYDVKLVCSVYIPRNFFKWAH